MKLLRRIAFLGFVLVAGGAAGGIWLVHTQQRAMERPLHAGNEPFVYMVRSGTTIGRIARDLEAAGLLESALRLELQARWSGAANRIKAGEYAFEPGLTPMGLLDLLVAGTVVQHPFTIVEGWTFRDLRHRIAESGTLVHTLDDLSGEEVMSRLGLEGLHPKDASFPTPTTSPAAPRTCSSCAARPTRWLPPSNRPGRGGRRISRSRHRTTCWCSRPSSRRKPALRRSARGSPACSSPGCAGA